LDPFILNRLCGEVNEGQNDLWFRWIG
jgi:hypothetical protein